ncbi:unnamed protein product [Alopecurus aequalis]
MLSSSEPVVLSGGATPAHTASTIVAEGVSGSHVLTVQGYSHTLGLGVCVPILSRVFNLGGHTWKILYWPDGAGHDCVDWISLSLQLHHTDDANNTEVKVRCRFCLLDQIMGEPVPEYSTPYLARTCNRDEDGITFHTFIKRDELETCLKDDSFSIRCDVSVANKEISKQPSTTTMPLVVTSPPSSDMARQFDRILETGEGADVTFEVGGETFEAHRLLLAARSSVFSTQLFGPMKENNGATTTARIIKIDDMEPKVFRMMLHFIYTDTLPPGIDHDDGEITTDMAQHLFVAADRYDLQRLKLICQNTLCSYMDARMVATTLALAEQHACDELNEACHRFLLASFQNLKAAMATDGFKHLKTIRPNILLELLRLRAADDAPS